MADSVRLLIGGLDALLLLFMAVFYWLMPGLTRRDLLFGVTVVPNGRETPTGRRIIRSYRAGVLLITVVLAGALVGALLVAPAAWWAGGRTALFVLLIVLYAIPYLLAYRASQELRASAEPEGMDTAAAPAAELRPRRYGDFVPIAWEALPLVVIAATAIYLIPLYAQAPATIPLHWNAANVADRFAAKTVGSFFLMVWTQLALYLLLTFLMVLAVQAKALPGAASLRFRRVLLRLLFALKVYLILILGVVGALTGYAATYNTAPPIQIAFVTVGLTLLVLVAVLVVAIRTGQGGSRLSGNGFTATDRLADQYWKWGAIYINRADPSIFLERRFGFGWTLNFGNPWSYVVLAVILLPAGIAVASSLMTRSH